MQYSQKYCLVSFIDPIEVNTEFSVEGWPLHVTLADVFSIERNSLDIQAKLKELLEKQPALKTFANKETVLGTTKVTLLDNTTSLRKLHTALIDLLETNGAQFNVPEFTREGFLPHCTTQKTARLNIKDEILIDNLALIDMFPNGDWQQRKVLTAFKLKARGTK
ncbi:MAG: 2'-5' RNA ligase family protein [Candidatus Saccharimonadales bacterium]